MNPDPQAPPAVTHSLWTIARIHNTLTGPTLTRRFLLDLMHAPEHQVMNVFRAWQRVAASIEASAQQAQESRSDATNGTSPGHPPTAATD